MMQKITHCQLREVDFLNILNNFAFTYATARNSPSRLNARFSRHPCLEIADSVQNIKKSLSSLRNDSFVILLYHMPYKFKKVPFDTQT